MRRSLDARCSTQRSVSELRPQMDPGRNRFLAIVGASGSGKSSLALAGLLPALQQGRIHGSSQWPVVRCRPGRDPVESLAVALLANPTLCNSGTLPSVDELIQKLREHKETLHLTTCVALHNEADACRVVVLADQFEEIFTQCDREDSRRCVIDNLTHAAAVASGRTLVVLTMRADFYGAASYPELAAMLASHQQLLGPLQRRELRQVIERPAQILGCQLEPGLTDLLLQAANHQPGTLPLLQYTLAQLWQRRQGHRLTIASYKDLGGLEAQSRRRPTSCMHNSRGEQRSCRRLLLRLTSPGDDGVADSRRRVPRGELDASSESDAVIDKLIAARLLTVHGNGRGEERPLEMATRHWPPLGRNFAVGWTRTENP